MALQTSGPISLNDMHVEVGGTSGTLCSVNDPDIRILINRNANTQQTFQEYYGKSSETELPTGGSTVNGQAQLKQISVMHRRFRLRSAGICRCNFCRRKQLNY